MSTINTNGLDVNYPIPGQNNNSQGFRNNFTNIKQNLDIAGNEISDLQNKAVLKTALANSTINNDMANTLIANASVLQFRNTTYNLGNALVGNVLVDCSIGDVQYGNLAGNINLQFGSWVPVNTKGGVQLQLGRPNANVNYSIFFPEQVIVDDSFGIPLVENYNISNNGSTISFPHGVTQINLQLTTVDCGNSIYVTPLNRPYKTTQIQYGTPPSTGRLGDVNGTIYMPDSVTQLKVTSTTTGTDVLTITDNDTSSLYTGMPLMFTGSVFGGVNTANTYYVRNVVSNTTFTVSDTTSVASNISLSSASGNMYANPISYIYVAVDNYSANAVNRNIDSTTAPNTITVSGSTANLVVNYPIIFTSTDITGNMAGLMVDTVYYVKTVDLGNNAITISQTRYNGVAGPEYQGVTTVGTGNVDVDYTVFDGPDIFRRIPLQPF
jgi:hypothetical protein